MAPEELVAKVGRAQREGAQKVGGRGGQRRLELPGVVFYTEVGQPMTRNEFFMVGGLIGFLLLGGVGLALWSEIGPFAWIPLALSLASLVTFFRMAVAGQKETLRRQDGVEHRGLYLADEALYYLQAERRLFVPRRLPAIPLGDGPTPGRPSMQALLRSNAAPAPFGTGAADVDAIADGAENSSPTATT